MSIVSRIVYLIFIVFVLILISEIASYWWHRLVTHKSVLNDVPVLKEIKQTHSIHHGIDVKYEHKGYEDFVWIVFGLCLYVLCVLIIIQMFGINGANIGRDVIIAIIIVPVLYSLFLCYLHSSTHDSGNWLMQYSIVKDISEINLVHHRNPGCNYSIVAFSDDLFGTTKLV